MGRSIHAPPFWLALTHRFQRNVTTHADQNLRPCSGLQYWFQNKNANIVCMRSRVQQWCSCTRYLSDRSTVSILDSPKQTRLAGRVGLGVPRYGKRKPSVNLHTNPHSLCAHHSTRRREVNGRALNKPAEFWLLWLR